MYLYRLETPYYRIFPNKLTNVLALVTQPPRSVVGPRGSALSPNESDALVNYDAYP